MEEILDMLENAFLEYDKVMEDNRLRGKLFFKIENVWKETNTVVMRGNAEKAETSDDKIILFPRKLPPMK